MTDPTTADNIETSRAQIVDRYSGLARQAMAGRTPTDSGTAGDAGECFGATQYGPDETLPEAALQASLGCGNPLAVADISPGETVLSTAELPDRPAKAQLSNRIQCFGTAQAGR